MKSDFAKHHQVRFFCGECGKEIWQVATAEDFAADTIEDILNTALCTDCMFKHIKAMRGDAP